MRRRVVCPRSHPASLYLRRLSGAFAPARSIPSGGRPPGPPRWRASYGPPPTYGQAMAGPLAARRAASGSRNRSARWPPPAPAPLPLLSPMLHPEAQLAALSGQLCRTRAGLHGPGKRGAPGPVACVHRNLPQRLAGGCLGAELCPRPGHPPAGVPPQPGPVHKRPVGQLGAEFCPRPTDPPAAPSPAAESRTTPTRPGHDDPATMTLSKPFLRSHPRLKGIDYLRRPRDAFFIVSLPYLESKASLS